MRRPDAIRSNANKAIEEIERIAAGGKPTQPITQTLAIVLAVLLERTQRLAKDVDYMQKGFHSVLKALSDEHQEVRDFLKGNLGATPRYDE